jgi:hypothetical protein
VKKLKKSLVGKLELPTKKADSHYLLFLLFIAVKLPFRCLDDQSKDGEKSGRLTACIGKTV